MLHPLVGEAARQQGWPTFQPATPAVLVRALRRHPARTLLIDAAGSAVADLATWIGVIRRCVPQARCLAWVPDDHAALQDHLWRSGVDLLGIGQHGLDLVHACETTAGGPAAMPSGRSVLVIKLPPGRLADRPAEVSPHMAGRWSPAMET